MSYLAQNLIRCLLGLFLTLTFMTSVSVASFWSSDTCAPTIEQDGVYILNCSNKDIDELPELPKEAEVLDFSRNRFEELPAIKESENCDEDQNCDVINTANNCRIQISFSRNVIDRFHAEAFHSLRCLSTLDVSFNKIRHDVLDRHTFQEGLSRVKFLDLHGNPLQKLPNGVISDPYLPKLQELDLSQCELEELGENSLDDLFTLQTLNLSNNKLKTIANVTFKGLIKLQKLDLRYNQLEYFPKDVFADLYDLEVLLLSNNKIKSFHNSAFYESEETPELYIELYEGFPFASDTNLLVLNLQSNQLSSIPYSAVDKLLKLQTLDLSQNPIQSVQRGNGYSNARNLVIDNTPTLTELGANALASFPNLVSLSISGNTNLRVIHSKALGGNSTKLRHVRMENNGLYTLTSDALPWKQLESVKLNGNPWLCDDMLRWMIESSAVQAPVICSEPLKMRGQDIKTLHPNQLLRIYPITPASTIILLSILLPTFGICGVLVWKRRRYFLCCKTPLKGRYVSVFTREVDDDGEQRVAIELKVNVNRLKAVSNGDADDTRPFIRIQEAKEKDEEEEI